MSEYIKPAYRIDQPSEYSAINIRENKGIGMIYVTYPYSSMEIAKKHLDQLNAVGGETVVLA